MRGTDVRGTVDAGAGNVSIKGYYNAQDSTRSTDTAMTVETATIRGKNIDIYGFSRGTGSEPIDGLHFYGNVDIRATGTLSVYGNSTNSIGLSTWRDGTTNLTLYAAGNITLTGISGSSSANAIDFTRYGSTAGTVKIGYYGSTYTTGDILIQGSASGGQIALQLQASIRSKGANLTIENGYADLSQISLAPGTISLDDKYTKITLGGTKTSRVAISNRPTWSASDSITWIEKNGLGVSWGMINDAVDGNINVFANTGASGDSTINDLFSAKGDVNIYGGIQTNGTSTSGYTGLISFGSYTNTAGGDFTVRSRGGITLSSSTRIVSTNGDIMLSTEGVGNFVNNAGASALSANNGRWVVYTLNPGNTTFGSLVSGNGAVWNQSNYSALVSDLTSKEITGNRFAFTTLPDTNGGYLVQTLNAPNKTYGDTFSPTSSKAYKISGSSLGNNPGAGSAYVLNDLPGVFTVTTSSTGYAATAGVGTYTITGTGPSTFNGQNVTYTNSGNIIVDPRVVTLTGSQVYDATRTLRAESLTLGNLANSDVVTISGSAENAISSKNVGSYSIDSITGLTLSDSNYTLAGATGTLEITKATLTASLTGAVTRVYDTTDEATLKAENYVLSGIFADDAIALNNPTSGTFDDKNVGTDKTVTVTGLTFSGTDGGNYELAASSISAAIGTITQAQLTVTGVTAADKVYDTTLTATLSGGTVSQLGTDVVTLETSGAAGEFDTKNVGTDKEVTATGYTLSGADAGNYAIVQPTGLTASISQAQLAVTGVTVADKVYDTTRTATLSGGAVAQLGTDVVTLETSGAAGEFDTKNVGTDKVVTATGYTLSGADAANYAIVQPTGLTASISQAQLTVNGVTAADKVYDTTRTATLNGGAVTQLGTDVVTLDTSGAAGEFDTKNVGTDKEVTATGYTLSGADAGNYAIVQPTGLTASISQAQLTVNGVTAADKVYDTTRTATLSGGAVAQLGTDVVTLETSGAAGEFDTKNVGTDKEVTATGYTLSGADAGNYAIVQPTGLTASISQASLNISGSFTAQNKVYTATTAAAIDTTGLTLSGVLGSDNVQLNIASATGSFADKNVGTGKTVTLSIDGSLAGSDAGNYVIAPGAPTSIANITQATLTASLTGTVSRTYNADVDATLAAANYNLSGTLGDDTVTLNSPTAGSFGDKNVGTGKTITVSGLAISGTDAANYKLALETITGTIGTITQAQLAVTGVAVADKVYDTTLTAMLSGGAVTQLGTDLVTLETSGATGLFDTKNVGTNKAVTATGYTLSGADAGNYAIVQPTGLAANVTPASLNISGSFTAQNRVYNATTVAAVDTAGLTLSGVLASDNVELNIASATGSFADKNVGTGKTVTLSIDSSLAGNDADNYVIAPGALTSSANVTPFALNLTLMGIGKVYDGNTDANVVVEEDNRFAGDDLSFGLIAKYADKNVGTGKAVAVSNITLTGADAGNYTVGSRSRSASSEITRLNSVAWAGAGDGVNWFDPANWALGAIPDLANVANVTLPASTMVAFDPSAASGSAETGTVEIDTLVGTLEIGTSLSLDRLEQSGGTIGGTGRLTIQDTAEPAPSVLTPEVEQAVERTTSFLQVANLLRGLVEPMNRGLRAEDLEALSELEQPWQSVLVDDEVE